MVRETTAAARFDFRIQVARGARSPALSPRTPGSVIGSQVDALVFGRLRKKLFRRRWVILITFRRRRDKEFTTALLLRCIAGERALAHTTNL